MMFSRCRKEFRHLFFCAPWARAGFFGVAGEVCRRRWRSRSGLPEKLAWAGWLAGEMAVKRVDRNESVKSACNLA